MATIQKKVSRGHTYWQIVESRRVNGKPRPIVLLHLGTAETLLQRLDQDPSQPVKAKVFQFGALAALWNIAQELDLVNIIDHFVPKREQGLTCGHYLLLAALNRCVEATSKASFYGWYRKTFLQRLLPVSKGALASQRFWDHMGYLDGPTIAKIEEALTQRLITHFQIDLRTLLLDATNFDTFIDTQTPSHLAQRGHAKSKRADLRIIGLALLVSADFHIPLLSHLYPGNQNDTTMFRNFSETLVHRYRQFADQCDRITLVFDGGNTSQENIQRLDQSDYHFITSLTLTHHSDLLQVPLRRFRSFADPRLKGVRAYRTTKEIWGQTRTVVITRSPNLLNGQIAGIKAALRKKMAALKELHQKLRRSQQAKAKGKGYTRDSLEKKLTPFVAGQYLSEILKIEIQEAQGQLDFTFTIDAQAWENLKRIRLGKRILCTDNHSWTTEEIILGSRAQSHIEQAFRQMKDPHWVSFAPSFHWTDQKLRVHAFYCIVALMLCTLLQRKTAQAGLRLTIPALLEQLSQVKEVVNLLPPGGDSGRGRLRAQYVLSERNPLQDKLCQIFEVFPLAHRQPSI
jgi:transposase